MKPEDVAQRDGLSEVMGLLSSRAKTRLAGLLTVARVCPARPGPAWPPAPHLCRSCPLNRELSEIRQLTLGEAK